MKTCPRCTLVSPDNAMWCDCGLDFSTLSSDLVKAELAHAQDTALRGASTGLVIGLGAIGFSICSYAAGIPIIFYGAALAGLLLLVRSIIRIVDIQIARKQLHKD